MKYNMLDGINSISPSFVKISYCAYLDLHIKFFEVFSSHLQISFLATGVYGAWAFIAGYIPIKYTDVHGR
jgi:hypothetical protein